MAVSWRVRVLVMWVMLGAVSLPVSAQPAPPAIQSASLSSATSASLNVAGYASVAFQFTGSWVATVQFEGSVDGSTYVALNATPPNSTTAVTSATANGVWFANAAGLKFARARVSAYTSGTVVVTIQAALSGGGSGGGGGGGGSGPSGTIGAAVPATASPAAVKDNAGNLAYPNLDASGNLLVAVTGAGSGGTSSTDGAGYTAGTTAGTPTMGARDDAGTTACAEDKVCIARLTSSRALMVDLSGTVANATAIKVDGSAVTQPVSGTVTANQGGAPWASNTTQLGGTAIDTNSGNKSAGTQRVVLATDQPQLTNALKVDGSAVTQPVSGTVTAAQATAANLNAEVQGDAAADAPVSGNPVQMGGRASAAAPADVSADGDAVPAWLLRSGAQAIQPTYAGVFQSTGNGTAGTGTPRVTIASDNTAFTVNAAQSGSWSLAANQSVNVAQFGGSATVTGTGVSGAGIPRMTVASDSSITANAGTNLNTSALALEATQLTGNTSLASIKTNTDPLVASGAGGYVRQDSTATIAKETGGNLATVKTNTDPLVASGAGGYVRQDSTATIAKETGGNLASIATSTAQEATNTGAAGTLDNDLRGLGGNDTTLLAILRLLTQQGGTPRTATAIRGAFGTAIGSYGDALKTYSANPVDPCSGPKANQTISQTTSTVLLTKPGGRVIVCSIFLVGADAENVAFVEGTGTTCGTSTAGVIGGTTAATGPNLAANGGWVLGNGLAMVAASNIVGNDFCLLQSGAGRVAGNFTYVTVR